MNCGEVRRRAPLYLSGEMEGEELRLFSAHLEECSACAAEIADQWRLDERIRATLETKLVPVDRIERAVRRRMAASARRWRLGAIAAAVLAVAVLGLWLLQPDFPQAYADAARDHRLEVVEQQPRHWRYGPELEAIAAESGISLTRAATIVPVEYLLERGKICRIGGVRMLHLVYARGPRRYSLYLYSHPGSRQALRSFHSDGEQVSGVETGRFRVMVVTEGAAAECAELAQSAARQL